MKEKYIKTSGYGLPDHFEYHEDTLFKVHNKLLYACISGAHDTNVEIDNKNYSIEGFRANKFSTGYVLFCKIVESALQIKRSSQYQNRIQTILSSSFLINNCPKALLK